MSTTRGSSLSGEVARLTRVALRLEYATVGWNVGEAVLTIALGAIASSLALIGFGTVSIVEVFASVVIVWHLRPSSRPDAGRTARAHRLVAIAFAILSVTLLVVSIRDLLTGRRPDESFWGIVYLAVTAVVMFGLAFAKRRIANRIDSTPLEAEASMTFLDGILSTATMLGLLLNATLGWWWADPAAALLVGIAAANEARENWQEASEPSEDPEDTADP
ncbi:MAG: cation transporter [Acidimicrobiia bacterium]|nr:cation transporter [Acidimicrobiia bacterium]